MGIGRPIRAYRVPSSPCSPGSGERKQILYLPGPGGGVNPAAEKTQGTDAAGNAHLSRPSRRFAGRFVRVPSGLSPEEDGAIHLKEDTTASRAHKEQHHVAWAVKRLHRVYLYGDNQPVQGRNSTLGFSSKDARNRERESGHERHNQVNIICAGGIRTGRNFSRTLPRCLRYLAHTDQQEGCRWKRRVLFKHRSVSTPL